MVVSHCQNGQPVSLFLPSFSASLVLNLEITWQQDESSARSAFKLSWGMGGVEVEERFVPNQSAESTSPVAV